MQNHAHKGLSKTGYYRQEKVYVQQKVIFARRIPGRVNIDTLISPGHHMTQDGGGGTYITGNPRRYITNRDLES